MRYLVSILIVAFSLLSCGKKYIESAAARDVELIIFPEMTLTGFSTDVQKNGEDRSSSQTIKKFSKVANRHNIAIIFGMTLNYIPKWEHLIKLFGDNYEIINIF